MTDKISRVEVSYLIHNYPPYPQKPAQNLSYWDKNGKDLIVIDPVDKTRETWRRSPDGFRRIRIEGLTSASEGVH